MEITIDLIENLTPEDIELILKYNELLSEAKDAVKIIKNTCLFHIGEKRIILSDDGNNREYLTFDGVWKARYLHQSYDIPVTVEGVFDVYKAEYEYRKSKSTQIKQKADSARYFRSCVRRLQNVSN
jgi:hypothetical protein